MAANPTIIYRLEKINLQCYAQQLCRRKSNGPGMFLLRYFQMGVPCNREDFGILIPDFIYEVYRCIRKKSCLNFHWMQTSLVFHEDHKLLYNL